MREAERTKGERAASAHFLLGEAGEANNRTAALNGLDDLRTKGRASAVA